MIGNVYEQLGEEIPEEDDDDENEENTETRQKVFYIIMYGRSELEFGDFYIFIINDCVHFCIIYIHVAFTCVHKQDR